MKKINLSGYRFSGKQLFTTRTRHKFGDQKVLHRQLWCNLSDDGKS